MALNVCIAGVTGWTGSAVAKAVLASSDFHLVGAVARTARGEDAGQALGGDPVGLLVSETVEEALASSPEVFIDYTHPTSVKAHVLTAVEAGVAAVVGTSGMTADDYAEIDQAARAHGVGVVAAGNFSITAALAKHFAGIAARHVPHWEIIDYASAGKPDAPSGTARELAEFLGEIGENTMARPVEETVGARDARGATIGGAQVHSLRLPSYVISFEAIFGLAGERLSVRHDAGAGAEPYVNGTLLAARKANETVGLVRGLDTLLFEGDP